MMHVSPAVRAMRSLVAFLFATTFAFGQTKPAESPPKFDIMDWTPRPALGQAEPWEKMRDPQWDDKRFLSTDTGPAFNATFGLTTDVIVGNKLVKQLSYTAYKGTAVKLTDGKNVGCVVFDRATCRIAAAWTGDYLQHSPRRFALLNTPTMPQGAKLVYRTSPIAGWADAEGKFSEPVKPTAPLSHIKYKGHYLHDNLVTFSYAVHGEDVLDTFWLDGDAILRRLYVAKSVKQIDLNIDDHVKKQNTENFDKGDFPKTNYLNYPYGAGGKINNDDFKQITKPGAARWGKPLVTKFVKGDESGPFAVDTLTIPYENPFKALFFCTGVDVLPDSRIAVCTCHGDVWLVTVDEAKAECRWQRYATGLYQPLGLKVVDKKVVVLERGQLTRLHDNNGDGEADFYECITSDWHTGSGEHSYDTCLDTDAKGNFYFFKTGDTELPHGGCLLKVSKDGSKVETFATGFRHPIGMGMSPDGILTGADQEGNWMPSTRIDEYKAGGFYGDMRAHHRKTAPSTYDPPLCWLPREVDNSAGGQAWVPSKTFGELAGLPLHFSYGRCRAFVLLRQDLGDGLVQGGVSALPLQFLSGSCRARLDGDGRMLVCGLNGWQTSAKADGSLQRVRSTGKPLDAVVKLNVTDAGIALTFARKLDSKSAENPTNYKVAAWDYRWSQDYGSERYKVSNSQATGQDELAVTKAKLLDESTVLLSVAGGVKPAMQVQTGYNLKSAEGTVMTGSVFHTIHQVPKAK